MDHWSRIEILYCEGGGVGNLISKSEKSKRSLLLQISHRSSFVLLEKFSLINHFIFHYDSKRKKLSKVRTNNQEEVKSFSSHSSFQYSVVGWISIKSLNLAPKAKKKVFSSFSFYRALPTKKSFLFSL